MKLMPFMSYDLSAVVHFPRDAIFILCHQFFSLILIRFCLSWLLAMRKLVSFALFQFYICLPCSLVIRWNFWYRSLSIGWLLIYAPITLNLVDRKMKMHTLQTTVAKTTQISSRLYIYVDIFFGMASLGCFLFLSQFIVPKPSVYCLQFYMQVFLLPIYQEGFFLCLVVCLPTSAMGLQRIFFKHFSTVCCNFHTQLHSPHTHNLLPIPYNLYNTIYWNCFFTFFSDKYNVIDKSISINWSTNTRF